MKASRFTAAHQSMTFSRRMMLVGGAQAAFGGILIARLGYLSVAQNQHYRLLSESNRVQLIIVPPRRGWILDRAGKPIAINRSDFRVDIIPEQLERPTETLRALTKILQLTNQLAPRGQLDPLPAGLSSQFRFQNLFKTLFADLEPRRDQQGVLFLLIVLG